MAQNNVNTGTTDAAGEKYQVGKTQAILLIIVLTLLYTINYADRGILSAVLQPMKIALGLSDSDMGLVQSIFLLGVGLLTIPGAFLMERWSRRKALAIMAFIWSLATFATGLAGRLWQVLTARFIVGVGEGSYAPGSNAWLSVVFSKEARGKVTGVFSIGSTLGIILGMGLGGYIVTKTGDWRVPFYIFGAFGVVIGILVLFFKDYATVKDNKQETALSKSYFAGWIRLFKIKSYTFTVLGQVLYLFYYGTLLGWLPALMMRGFGLDAAQAGGMVAVTFLLGVVGAPLGGWLADIWHKRNKTGRAYLMAISHLLDLILIGTMFFFYTKSLTIFMVLLAIDTVMAGFMSTLVYSMTSDVVPIRFRISGFSLLMTCGFAIGALGPWTVGLISDAFGGGSNGLQMGFFMTLPALLLSTLFYSLSCISYAPDSARCSDLVYQDNK